MSEELRFSQMAAEMLDQLPRGAFLSVAEGGKTNTMTIGWGSIGIVWSRPVMMVMVRHSRYTNELIEQSQEFTVSVPLSKDFRKELAFAGTKSGRDCDKFKELGIQEVSGRKTEAPVIPGCGLIYECRILLRQEIDAAGLDESVKATVYPDGDYHVLYFGEILACYRND